jgi:hypothetical protein
MLSTADSNPFIKNFIPGVDCPGLKVLNLAVGNCGPIG